MKNIVFILFVAFCNTFALHGQSNPSLWLKTGISKKINKKFTADLSIENRWAKIGSFHQTYFGELGIAYKLTKKFSLEGYYRYINRRRNESSAYNSRHRFYGNLEYETKIQQLRFKYRLRYQNQFRDNETELTFDKSYFRNKIELGYTNKSIFTPYISTDLFYQIRGIFDEVRIKVGSDIKITKTHRLDIAAFLSQPIGSNKEAERYVIDIGYKYKF
jgi:hypothetical protein